MTLCPDCSEEITCAEITRPDGSRFVSVHDAEHARLMYRAEFGYTVRAVTGRACSNQEAHYGD